MLDLKKYQNKKIAIYGMGITGLSAAKTFKSLKAKVYCWDDNLEVRKKIKKLNFNIQKFWLTKNLVNNIVISPGIDVKKCKIKKYLRKNKNKIITDLDLFFEINKNATIISITGTNGKSTTCKIIEKILITAGLKVKTLGNIGSPVLFSNKAKEKNIFILEVSSYQLEYSKLIRSTHAAILNISPDHLDRHKNIKNYIKIKSKIFLSQQNSDYSYINSKNKYSEKIKKIFKAKKIKSKLILINSENSKFLLKKINNKYFNSRGNIDNLYFAYKIAKNLNINTKTVIKAVNQFKGLPHRQEVIFSNKKLQCINDSKATSFEASLQSLLNYDKIYWIVGGLPKKQDYIDLKKVEQKIVKAYVIGKNTSFFEKKIRKNIKYKISKNIKNALNDIYNDLKLDQNKKYTILLSPAAASFDQFDNFEKRGLYFKSLVKKKFKNRSNV
jgi:UDP-N-acetylmuramoylalanine--D-glutamate ligase